MENYKTYSEINFEIIALRKAVFVEEQNIPYVLEIEKDEEKYLHFCFFDDQNLIAYARGRRKGSAAYIGRVCVHKNYRRLGYGSKIMRYAEAELMGDEIQEFQLNAQATAKEFYRQLGYEVVGKGFMEAGILHYPMKKIIKK